MTVQDRISGSYADLSDKLRVAAKFVSENPAEIATRSLRSVAQSSGVSPATFSRLARALGYRDYEQLREEGRLVVERQMSPFSERAAKLRAQAGKEQGRALLEHQSAACIANVEKLVASVNRDALERAVRQIDEAKTVLLVGSMGSAGVIDYLGYMGQWFKQNWKVAGRNGIELSATLSRINEGDVVVGLVKAPYARRTVAALKAAQDRGAKTVVISDSPTSPALQFANHSFIVATQSPQFFSSYAATLVLLETIISMLIARAGPDAEEQIRAAEQTIERLGENWTP
ncbi:MULTISPECIES: MurR/RpiR family transcriptional regulator [Roseobacter]|uniref:Glycine-cleavage T protein with oxidoreductase activity (FAD-dependent) n=1 Tax=Roseobacter litoralis (strain ATCC 49566 / DSM 6996 / JCM 21268 / NBRC 15278 / OCh 149) TaxID=391595 RepID=F7ZHH6_ROSLO|nr:MULTISPECIES: MurR/RpiR family transcriptional regulator [Roseobacter]AEI92387.1 putative glycine-cleavage T protein with oxidoreductase activity (FAD-dependent) [Roseobacter litoralis Och 149]GIT88569.1 RpiR family transcriptional regulator [Roseobacter sp. OBYS 0001]